MHEHSTAMRVALYALGMTLLAIGLTLTAETELGTSPLTSIAFVLAAYTNISFSDMTFLVFCIYIAVQLVLRFKKEKMVFILLQIPLSVAFTQVMRITQGLIDIGGCTTAARLLFLLIAIALTGTGAAMTIKMRLIPNPGDGIVHALSQFLGKPLGTTKNLFDIASVCMAAILSLLLMNRLVGVGTGSVIAMLGVGRVITLYNKATRHYGIKQRG